MALFTQNEALAAMAQELAADYYPEIERYGIKIAYMFKDTLPHAAGLCRKVGDLDRQLHGFDFVIVINKALWDAAGKRGDQVWQSAIMDHELAHVGIVYDDETGEPRYDKESDLIRTRLIEHSVEEFEEIIRRYGPYAEDLRRFQRAFEAFQSRGVVPKLIFEDAAAQKAADAVSGDKV